MRLRPRMPAAARESMARGVTAMDAQEFLVPALPEEEENNQEENQVSCVDVF